jgi:hypothetical protein
LFKKKKKGQNEWGKEMEEEETEEKESIASPF